MLITTKKTAAQSDPNNFEREVTAFAGNVEKGFTVVELLVSMVIFLIVTGTIFGVMQVAQRSREVVSEQSHLNKNVRIALNLVGRDTYNAGYGYPLTNAVVLPDNKITTLLGLANDANSDPDPVPPIIAGNNINPNTFNQTAGVTTDQVTFLFQDSTFNRTGAVGNQISESLSISDRATVGGIDEVTIAAASGTNAATGTNEIYLINGDSGSTLGLATGEVDANKVQFADNALDVLDFNQPGTGGLLRNLSGSIGMQRINLVTYFVTTDGVLTRREFANAPPVANQAFVDEPLVYGVENFQIQYLLENGTVVDNPANLSAVRQIRYTVNTRSTELNAAGQPYRVNMSTTFSTRNLGYDAN